MYFRSHIGKVEYDEVVGELPSGGVVLCWSSNIRANK